MPSTPSGEEYYQPPSDHRAAACVIKSPPILSESIFLKEQPDRLANEISNPPCSTENANDTTEASNLYRSRRRLCLNTAHVTASEEDGTNGFLSVVKQRDFRSAMNHQSLDIGVEEATIAEERNQRTESPIPSMSGSSSCNEKSNELDIRNHSSSGTVNANFRIRNLKAEILEINDKQAGEEEKGNVQLHTQVSCGSDVVGSERSRAFAISTHRVALKRPNILQKGYDREKRLEIERRVHNVQRGFEPNAADKTAYGESATIFLFEDENIFA